MGDNSRCLISAKRGPGPGEWGGERFLNRQVLTEDGKEGRGMAERRLRIQHGAVRGQAEGGKKMEAAGGFWAKWRLLFMLASTARHTSQPRSA